MVSIRNVDVVAERKRVYLGTAVVLFLGYFLLRDSAWRGSMELHTLMEAIATVLALNVGILALVRFYSKKDNTFLFVGTGFLATGLLDGYHAIVTSSFFSANFPSPSPSLIPWSWLASRLFLSVLLWLSWVFWKREDMLGETGRVSERWVYAIVGGLALMCFFFFAFVTLPPAYYPKLFFPRPQEFLPSGFFLLALIGYLRKGRWKNDIFEHWLVLSIIVGFMGQVMFMSFSGKLYDGMFDTAHLLKKLSYIFALIGLLISMYQLFLGATTDLNERKRAEEALRLGSLKHQLLFESSRDALMMIAPPLWKFSGANQATLQLFGAASMEEFTALGPWNVSPERQPDGRPSAEKAQEMIGKAMREGSNYFEWEHQRLDGRAFAADVLLTRMEVGKELFVQASVRDITERKQKEERIRALNDELEAKVAERTTQLLAAQEELVRKEKLALLGQVADNVGHELRNPLGVMNNAVYFLQTVLVDADETTKEYLGIIKEEIVDAERIVSDLLDAVRTKAPHPAANNIAEAIEKTLHKCTVPASVNVHLELPQTLPPVRFDPMHLHQVFWNLITNAVEAMPDGGTLIIRADEAQQGIRISVRDSGIGMTPEQQAKLFQPMFTTKARRVGLGLMVVKNLSQLNGGSVEVESSPDKGSVFTVTLPCPS